MKAQVIVMSDYITYSEWLNAGGTITDIVDDSLAKSIEDWFFSRKIGWKDNKIFSRYLHRNISVNLDRYNELLRLQPGVSQYDWLVENYKKSHQKQHGEGGNTRTHGNDTSTFTADMYKYDSDLKEIITNKNNDVVDTSVRSGNEDHVRTGGHSNIRSGNEDNTKGGGHTVKDIQGKITTEVSPHVGTKTQNGGHTSGWKGNRNLVSANPMSKSYSEFTKPSELKDGETPESQEGYFKSRASEGMPGNLNWETLTQQGQDDQREYNVDKSNAETSYVYGPDGKGDITVTQGDAENPGTSITTYQDEKDIHTYNDVKDQFSYDENGENDKITYNDVQDRTQHEGYTSQTAPHENGKNETVNQYGNIEDKNMSDSKSDSWEKGRNEAPADILERAVRFIEHTNAFQWLCEQIDCCFLADLED